MKNKSLLVALLCYFFWGAQPLYWSLLGHMDSMFILASRIIWAAVFTVGMLALQGRLKALWAVFRDKRTMGFLIPASLFLLVDWGVFIWAVQAGQVLDTSLGYYMNPLVILMVGLLLFHEKCGRLQLAAIGLAAFGVLLSALRYGRIPMVSLVLAFAFAIYGVLKKYARVEALVSIAAESLLLCPLALLFILFFRRGDNGLAAVTVTDQLLLMGSGVVTALPMILYSVAVLDLPLTVMGFFQYISPTISLFCGFLMGESLSEDKLICFLFIWAGLILFSIGALRQAKRDKAGPPEAAPPATL